MREGSSPMSVDLAETSTWGMTSKRYTSSERIEGSFQGSGVWEANGANPGSIDELLHTQLGGSHVATYLPLGDGFGNRARLVGGTESSFEITSPGDDAVGFSFEIVAKEGFINKGRVLRALGGDNSISADGNGASYDDLGAAGTTIGRLGATLHVMQKGGGAGTLTVKVQHSPDQSVWTDLITFTGRTVADVAEYLEVAATIQRYLRALWTVSGGTWDFHVAAGRR
jgi:hypothetical protein